MMALDPEATAVLKEFYGLRAGDPMPSAQKLRDGIMQAYRLGKIEGAKQVDITTLGDADRVILCNACGHVHREKRETAE